MDALSSYMSKAGGQTLPDDVVEKIKHHILDTIAAMFSGTDLPPGRVAHAFARKFKLAR
jgi:2-methylcitrate dehydratase PrpD